MLKMLLGKSFDLDAVPVAVAMSVTGSVLVTMKAPNGNEYSVTFEPLKATPTQSRFSVTRTPDGQYV